MLKTTVIIFFIVFLSFLKAPFLFDQVESGIYFAYTESFVEDGDLNIVDQQVGLNDYGPVDYDRYKNGEKGIVSPTYNSPTVWSHGGVILWTPFYLCGLLLDKIAPPQNNISFTQVSLVLANIFYVVLGLVLTTVLLRLLNKKNKNILPVIIISFLGTPLFFYTLVESGNGNVVGLFFVPLILILALKIFVSKKIESIECLGLGVLCGVAWVVKVDMVFYSFVLGVLLIRFYFNRERVFLKGFLVSIIGWSLPVILQAINDTIKYGFVTYGYLDISQGDYSVLFDTLFSAYRGHIYVSPLYGIIVLLSFFLFWNYKSTKNKTTLLVAMLPLIFLVKQYFATQTFVHGSGNFGARMYCVEVPVVIILLYYYFQQKKILSIQGLFCFISVLWTMIMFYFYYRVDLLGYNHMSFHVTTETYIKDLLHNSEDFFNFFKLWLLEFDGVYQKLFFIPHILILSYLLARILLSRVSIEILSKKIWKQSFLLFSLYFLVTLINLKNNQENIEVLKEKNFFEHMIIGKGEELYLYEENINSIEERMMHVRYKDPKDYLKLIDIRRKYHEKAISQLITFSEKENDLRGYFPFPEHGYDKYFQIEKIRSKIPGYDSSIR